MRRGLCGFWVIGLCWIGLGAVEAQDHWNATGELHIEDDQPPQAAILHPTGGERWVLSTESEPSNQTISWNMSDNEWVCQVDVELLHSNDDGNLFVETLGDGFPITLGNGPGCHPAERVEQTAISYTLPTSLPSGNEDSIYKIRLRVVDQNSNATETESSNPFFIVDPDVPFKTLILHHPDRMAEQLGSSQEDLEGLNNALHTLAEHQRVQGLIVDLGNYSDLQTLYDTWDASQTADESVGRANQVLFGCHEPFPAECNQEDLDGIHDVILRIVNDFPDVEHLVLVGDDRIIPMARMRDGATLLPESTYTDSTNLTDTTTVGKALASDTFLSDDPLADMDTTHPDDLSAYLFIPDLAVGRLVETPSEILTTVQVFLARDGELNLSALDPESGHKVQVIGYDFLQDAAKKNADRWHDMLVNPIDDRDDLDLTPLDSQLIGQDWDELDLASHLCGNGGDSYGIVNLNSHATHYEEGIPGPGGVFDIQGISTQTLNDEDLCGIGQPLDLFGSIVYSVGCHSGLSVAGSDPTDADNSLDLPQTYLGRGAAVYLGNSGYGWGLRHGVGYSERLVGTFTHYLSGANTGLTVGSAVLWAKRDYAHLATDAYHEKTLMQWTLYGLPMYSVRLEEGEALESPTPKRLPRADELPSEETLPSGVVVRRRTRQGTTDSFNGSPPPYMSIVDTTFILSADGIYEKFTADGDPVDPSVIGCPGSETCYYALNGIYDLTTTVVSAPIEPYIKYFTQLLGTSRHGSLWLGGTYEEEENWQPVFTRLISNGAESEPPEDLPRIINILPTTSDSERDACRSVDMDPSSLMFPVGGLMCEGDHCNCTIHGCSSATKHRRYSEVQVETFYFSNADHSDENCDRLGPTMSFGVEDTGYHLLEGTNVEWNVKASDNEDFDPNNPDVWRVVVVYDVGDGEWRAKELAYDSSEPQGQGDEISLWTGDVDNLEPNSVLTYVIQAVDLRGNVTWLEWQTSSESDNVIVPRLADTIDVRIDLQDVDLELAADVSLNPVLIGNDFSLLFDVHNLSLDELANDVQLDVCLPPSLALRAYDGNDGWACAQIDPQTACSATDIRLQCIYPLLEATTVAPRVVVPVTAPETAQILSVMAEVSSAQEDIDLSNNAVDLAVIVESRSDVEVTLTSTATSVQPGEITGYIFSLRNYGPDPILGLELDLAAAPEFAVEAWDSGPWDLAPGANQDVLLRGQFETGTPAGSYSHTVEAVLPALNIDNNLTNNLAEATTTVVPEGDLAIEISNDGTIFSPGDELIYTLTVSSQDGSAPIHGVEVQVTIPPELENPVPTHGTWTNLTVTPETPVELEFTATIAQGTQGHLSVTATVLIPEGYEDSDPTNNSATALDQVVDPTSVFKTLILHYPDRFAEHLEASPADLEDLELYLHGFAAHPRVQGLVLDLGQFRDIQDLYAAWDASETPAASVSRANNLLFGCHEPFPTSCPMDEHGEFVDKDGIHDWVLGLSNNFPDIENLVLIGDDRILPMARIREGDLLLLESTYTDPEASNLTPDGTTVGQALAENTFLSDDPLASSEPIHPDDLNTHLFLPDLAVGRLVETPSEILITLQTFLDRDGVLDLSNLDPASGHKVQCTGYDFLQDVATRNAEHWHEALGGTGTWDATSLTPIDGELIGQEWQEPQLANHLCGNGGNPYGIINLNGHANHYEEGIPGSDVCIVEGISTAELISPDLCGPNQPLDLSGSVVYSIGCHSGLPVAGSESGGLDNSLDLAQTFLGRGAAVYIGNSGYGWGLRYGIGFSERLVELFTRRLSDAGPGLSVGSAVHGAKVEYAQLAANAYDATYDRKYDEKTLMQWTVFGLPMYSVRLEEGDVADPLVPAPLPRIDDLDADETLRSGIRIQRQFREEDTEPSGGSNLGPILGIETTFSLPAESLYEKYTAAGDPVDSAEIGCPSQEGCYYLLNRDLDNLPSLTTTSSGAPIEPFLFYNSQVAGSSQHGVLWLGGTYEEEPNWKPVFADLISNHAESHAPEALPRKIRILPTTHDSGFGACRTVDTNLNSLAFPLGELVCDGPDCHCNGDGCSTGAQHRLYSQARFEFFYLSNTDDSDTNCDRMGPYLAPGFDDVSFHRVAGNRLEWSIEAWDNEDFDPDHSDVWRVLVVYDLGEGEWEDVDLELRSSEPQEPGADDISRWEGSLDVNTSGVVSYVIQAVDRRGNVSWNHWVPTDLDPLKSLASSTVLPPLADTIEVDIVLQNVDLDVDVTAGQNPVLINNNFSLLFEVHNLNPDEPANGLHLDICLPDSLTFGHAVGEGWTCRSPDPGLTCHETETHVQCDHPLLLPDSSAPPVEFQAIAPSTPQRLTVHAEISAVQGDPELENNAATAVIAVQAESNVEVSWVDPPPTLHPGDSVTFNLALTNHGPDPVHGVDVEHSAPDWLLNPTLQAPWSDLSLEANGTRVLTLQGIVDPETPAGEVALTVQALVPEGYVDLDVSNNVATTLATVVPIGDLAIQLINGDDVFDAGSELIYAIILSNNGPDPMHGVEVQVAIPSDLENPVPTDGIWTDLTVTPETPVELEFTATIAQGTQGDLSVTATVVVPEGYEDPDPTNNSDTDVDLVEMGPPSLLITKTANPDEVPWPGAEVEFTVTVANTSDIHDPVDITSLVDDIHGDLDGRGTCDVPVRRESGEDYTCSYMAFVGGDSATFQTSTTTAAGTDNEGTPVEASDDVTVNIVPAQADLQITQTDNRETIQPGATVTYSIEVTNLGPDRAIGISVVDTPPALLEDVTQITWHDLSLDPGETDLLAISGMVPIDANGQLENVLEVILPPQINDPVPGNNVATDLTDIMDGPPSITVTLTAEPDMPQWPEDDVTFTVTVENTSDLSDVFTLQTLVSDVHGDLNGQGDCTLPQTIDLGEASEPYSCQYAATVSGDVGDTHDFTVLARGVDDEGDPAEDDGSVTVTVVDTVGPQVEFFSSVSDTGDGRLDANETTSATLTQLHVHFNEVMDTASVEDVNAYRLIEAGSDGVLQTETCGSPQGDDASLSIDQAMAVSDQHVAIWIHGGVTLPRGRYRLWVCDSITDTLGNPMQETSLDFQVVTEHQLRSSNFDSESSLGAWILLADPPTSAFFGSGGDREDIADAETSGSIELSTPGGFADVVAISQCVRVGWPQVVELGGGAKIHSVSSEQPELDAILDLFDNADCDGDPAESVVLPLSSGSSDDQWIDLGDHKKILAAGTKSVLVILRAQNSSQEDSPMFEVLLDDLYLKLAPLHGDGFESGDTSMWSNTVP